VTHPANEPSFKTRKQLKTKRTETARKTVNNSL